MNAKKKILIIGAGIAGLSAAWKLTQHSSDFDVVLIEQDSEPGGLAKSIPWNDTILDLGPHRFHTEIDEVRDFIKTFCQSSMKTVKRHSRMYLNGCYIPYPIKALSTFRALGLMDTINLTASALAVLFQRQQHEAASYEEYVIRYYGKGLYHCIFEPFTQKVWGLPPSQIDAETARTRLKGDSIWHALKDGLFSKEETYVAEFLYPPNGIGQIALQFADEASKKGVTFMYNHRVTQLNHDGKQITSVVLEGPSGTQQMDCDVVISTIPIGELMRSLTPTLNGSVLHQAKQLDYRSLVLLYMQFPEVLSNKDTWLYYPESHVPFSRISVPEHFMPHRDDGGKSTLCLEFPCQIGDEIWSSDADSLSAQAVPILQKSGLIHTEMKEMLTLRIKEGYPLYRIGYRKNLNAVMDSLSIFSNCLTTGRQGLFRHNNLDQSIQMGLHAAQQIQQHPESMDAWYDSLDRYDNYRIID